jgi:hypothetical protein
VNRPFFQTPSAPAQHHARDNGHARDEARSRRRTRYTMGIPVATKLSNQTNRHATSPRATKHPATPQATATARPTRAATEEERKRSVPSGRRRPDPWAAAAWCPCSGGRRTSACPAWPRCSPLLPRSRGGGKRSSGRGPSIWARRRSGGPSSSATCPSSWTPRSGASSPPSSPSRSSPWCAVSSSSAAARSN